MVKLLKQICHLGENGENIAARTFVAIMDENNGEMAEEILGTILPSVNEHNLFPIKFLAKIRVTTIEK
ncbi:MAG: hypothetical protein LBI69_00745 [Puniceicoccales bacterium]|jgi:hypothetical protein|nr:hypothetical protein [Puniceicoccales bacterium]